MGDDRTAPSTRAAPSLPVQAVRAEVIDGPDAGAARVGEGDALTIGTARGNDLVLRDPTVSRFHVELRRDGDRVEVRDLGSTNGTLIGPCRLRDARASVEPGTVLILGDSRLRIDDGRVVMVEAHAPGALLGVVGEGPAMRRVMASVEALAESDVSVLLVGESGTGKEVVARALHELG